MKRIRIKRKFKVYPVIWSGIIVVSIYLLIKFVAISLSDNMGQAGKSLKDMVSIKLCSWVFEESSSLVEYTSKEDGVYNFPVSLVADEFALHKFTDTTSVMTVTAPDYPSLLTMNDNYSDVSKVVEAMGNSKVHNGINFYNIDESNLSRAYILSNGAIYSSEMEALRSQRVGQGNSDQLEPFYSQGDVYNEETEGTVASDGDGAIETTNVEGAIVYSMDQLKDINFLVRNCYIVHNSTKVTENLFDAEKLLSKDMTMKQKNDAPQILIYHTHSQEAYIDSRPGKVEDTVVGIGDYLTDILEEKYDYNVIHDTSKYDVVDGKHDRNGAYDRGKAGLTKILEKNPTIEVMIDLHRDEGSPRIVILNGKETANIMLFNGLSRDQNGPITYLDNPNLSDNLAFSLQLQLKSKAVYPKFFYRNFLKSYRFNMHFRPKSLLIELGTVENTVESAYNAMEPFASLLDSILQGK